MARKKSSRPPRTPLWQVGTLWLVVFLGGFMTGVGVFLVAQIKLIDDIRNEVIEIGGLKRFFGRMTFLWRGLDQKLALTLHEVPEEYLRHSETAGWSMAGVGFMGFACLVPIVLLVTWRLRR